MADLRPAEKRKGEQENSGYYVGLHLRKVGKGEIPCLFFGKCVKVFPLAFKKVGHPSANSYPLSVFENPNLDRELEVVEEVLGIPHEANTIYRLLFGYVHVYSKSLPCSALKLSAAIRFFSFDTSTPMMTLPRECKIDIKPFVYAKDDLERMDEDKGEDKSEDKKTEYAWKTEELVSWDWNEEVWSQRLFQCIQHGFTGVKVVPAFWWKPNGYQAEISTIFSNVKFVHPTPFHGMTDILLLGEKRIALVRVQETTVVCSAEVGVNKEANCAITIAGEVKVWPEKMGELLASMHFFGTLNYVNNLRAMPEDHFSFATYGLLAIRSIGCIVLEMVLDHTGCHVKLVHEGGMLSLGEALEYVVGKLKTN